jgi:hypothetical protein
MAARKLRLNTKAAWALSDAPGRADSWRRPPRSECARRKARPPEHKQVWGYGRWPAGSAGIRVPPGRGMHSIIEQVVGR